MDLCSSRSGAARWALGISVLLLAIASTWWCPSVIAADEPRLQVLLIGGSSGSHRPAEMAALIKPALQPVGIDVTYTEDLGSLAADKLASYDAIAIYKDDGDLSQEQEQALIQFVSSGNGLVAIHCASHCFRASNAYTKLVGGRFHHHGHGEFTPRIVDAQHPAMEGLKGFKTLDETYVHDQLGTDLRMLMCREESGAYEPYTWVRRHGAGRVFYTALGHDQHTWSNPGFHRLIERAIRWAAGKLPDEPAAVVVNDIPTVGKVPSPLSPEESQKRMHLPEGFRVELFASEPDVIKPLAMTFDARGRVWLIESTDYPNDILPPGQGHDRIKICEDTDGDGRADKFTVFAEGFNIPTGLAFGGGGLIVACAPDVLLLIDNDGDDVADERRVLFTGFHRPDTHAVHGNLHYGLDNWMWGTVGYSGGRVRVGGAQHVFRQGLFRFRPDGSAFEVLTATSNNTWGLGFSESGDVFASTANNQHSVHLAIPNRYYERVRGWHGTGSAGIEDHKQFHAIAPDLRQVDWHGGYTAASGHELYTARDFPPEYWDHAALVCEPTGHLVHVDFLVPHGTGFIARDGYNLLASADPWTAPTQAQVGPDGAVWMIDWYNYIVRHNPTPPGFETGPGNAYVTPDRDKSHGRIYRIVYGDRAKSSKRPNLDSASDATLVATLANDNLWWRLTAQRLLIERQAKSQVSELARIVREANAPAALHALCVLEGLGQLSDHSQADLLKVALRHRSAAVRRRAADVLPRTEQSAAMLLDAGLLADADANVRLHALLALAETPGSQAAADQIAKLACEPTCAEDPWLPSGIIAAAAASDVQFLTAMAQHKSDSSLPGPAIDACRQVAEHYVRGKQLDDLPRVLAEIASASPTVAEPVVAGLAAGWPADREFSIDPSLSHQLAALMIRLSPESQLQLATLGRRWGAEREFRLALESLNRDLQVTLFDESQPDEKRIAAVAQWVTITEHGSTAARLVDLLGPRSSPALASGVLTALARCDVPQVATAVIASWPKLTPDIRRAAVGMLLERPAWTKELLGSIERREVSPNDLAVDQLQQLSGHPDKTIAARARSLLADQGQLASSDRQQVLDRLLPLADRYGDATAGRIVFEQNCAKCHRHGSIGEPIGPDLTGVALRPRREVLADVLDPNRSVEGNFRQYVIQTTDGRVLSGLLLNENKTAVELLDSQANRLQVLRSDIEEFLATNRSVMPEGFERLGEESLVSLLEFLSSHGRFVPVPLGKAATITSVRGMFYDRSHDVERLVFDDWGPKAVGEVPFQLVDPREGKAANVILLHGPEGPVSAEMPREVTLDCRSTAAAIHLLGGVSGWGYPLGERGSISVILRVEYADGETEDHELRNGVHFADYIRRVDVPESKFAFVLGQQQIRYLSVKPKRAAEIARLHFIKGADRTAPVIMAITIELPDSQSAAMSN